MEMMLNRYPDVMHIPGLVVNNFKNPKSTSFAPTLSVLNDSV